MENAARGPQQPESHQPETERPEVGRAEADRSDAGRAAAPTTTDPEAARAALDAVEDSKAVVAQQMRRGPRWYNPVYGVLCGLLVLSIGLPRPWFVAGVLVSAIGLGLLAGTYRKRTGIVLGTGNPRPRGIYPWLIAVLGVGAGASYLDGHHGFPLGVPIVAVAAGVACWVLSRRYDAALFALLEADDGVERVGGVGGDVSQGGVRP
jgi:hypothetical protein